MYIPFKKTIQKIQATNQNKKLDKVAYERFKKIAIQATGSEGWRDVLSWEAIQDSLSRDKQPDKNNYPTYESQVTTIYRMYYNEADYGGELLRGLIDTRTSLLCGEGININVYNSDEFLQTEKDKKVNQETKPKALQQIQALREDNSADAEIVDEKQKAIEDFINQFIEDNQLDGAGLMDICETGEKEGKVLIILNKVNDKIKINIFNWYQNKYNVQRSVETGEIESITYGKDNTSIPLDRAVFIQLYGLKTDPNKTPPRIANVLTQIENRSRAKYDLRKNNHLFAKLFLWYETSDKQVADSIENYVKGNKTKIGESGAGQAKPYYISPSVEVSNTINLERTMDLKDIANAVGIPVFFNDPELLSNKALGNTMMEAVNQSTKKERLIYQVAFKELIQKAMQMGVDNSIEGAIYEPDMFDITMPLITMDTLQSLVDVWSVLCDGGYISKQTVMGKIPGINPMVEKKLIEEEKKESVENNPLSEQMGMDNAGQEENKLLNEENKNGNIKPLQSK